MAWSKLTTKTLESATQDVVTDQFTSSNFMMIMCHFLESTTAINHRWQFGDGGVIDTGSNYASRRSINGASELTASSQNYIWFAADSDSFSIGHMMNLATEEKLVMGWEIHQGTTGAGTAPGRQEWTGKWVETTNQCDKIEAEAGSAVNVAIDSNLSALGSDLTPAAGITDVQTNSIFIDPSTAKRYWFNGTTWVLET